MLRIELPQDLEYKEIDYRLYDDIDTTLYDYNLIRQLLIYFDEFKNEDELKENINFIKDNISLYYLDGSKLNNDDYDLEINPENEFELFLIYKSKEQIAKGSKYLRDVVLTIYF